NFSKAVFGLRQRGLHGLALLDQAPQQPPLGAFAGLGGQALNTVFPLTSPRRNGVLQSSVVLVSFAVHVVDKQLGQVRMVSGPRGQASTHVPADQPSRFPVEKD